MAALWKHTESMYFTFFAQSPGTHDPSATPRMISLHQPSTLADRSLGRFAHDSPSHWPSDSHSLLVKARFASSVGCLAATPVDEEAGAGVAPPHAPQVRAAQKNNRETAALFMDSA